MMYVTFKSIADRAGALVLTGLLAPVLLAVAAAVKLEDGGPVFFRQERLGKDAAVFRVWKFRTMVVDADRFLDDQGRATRNRVTRIGRFLRATSLDELPQLFNILAGDMALIGPRPVLPSHLARYSAEQRRRFAVRPGITGLAQVNGRNTLPWSQRLAYDVAYVDGLSLHQDLAILLKTVRVVLLREGVAPDRNPGEVDDLPTAQEMAVSLQPTPPQSSMQS